MALTSRRQSSLKSSQDLQLSKKERSFLSAEDGMSVARQFLGEYYRIYDSDNKEPLVSAYHDNAVFSIGSQPTR
jgi:nuclear RNA export factor